MLNQQPTNADLLNAIQGLNDRMDTIEGKLVTVQGKLNTVEGKSKTIEDKMDSLVTKRDLQDVLEVINKFASDTEVRFIKIENDVNTVKSDMNGVKSSMVTKDYLDMKIAELRSDLTLLSRKSNTKLTVLIESLVEQQALRPEIAQKILALEPFPQQ